MPRLVNSASNHQRRDRYIGGSELKYTGIPLASTNTTVKISRDTLSHLERVREEMKAKSLDETVRELIKSHRRRILAVAFGVDKGRVKSFTERDRGEDR